MPPGYQPYGATTGAPMNYASWGARLGGYILNALSAILFGLPAMISFFAGPREYQECTIDGKAELCKLPTDAGWVAIAVLGGIGFIALFVLYFRGVGTKGQFWGHRAAGVRIVDGETGAPIGFWKAVLRQLLHTLDSSICFLGYLWPLWDKKKQTFADKIVGSVAIRA